MSKPYSHPADEFDVKIAEGAPQGAHRARRSKARGVLIALLVIILAGGIGYAATAYLPPLLGFTANDVVDMVRTSDAPEDAADGGDESTAPTDASTPAKDATGDNGKAGADAGKSGTDAAGSANAQGDSSKPDETAGAKDSKADEKSGEKTDQANQTKDQPKKEPVKVDKATAVRVLNSTRTTGMAGRASSKLSGAGWTNVRAANYTGQPITASVVWYQGDQYASAAKSIAKSLGISSVREMANLSGPISVVLAGDFR